MRFSVGLLFVVCGAVSLWADTLSIQTSGLPPYQYDGYYVGPAKGTDNGQGPIDLWCDDFAHTTQVPTTYYANVSTVSSPTGARFTSDSDYAVDYEEIAWLMSQYYSMATKTNQSVGDLQFAIWLIFDPGVTALQTSGALAWVNKAENANLNQYNYNAVRIFTPTNCSGTDCAPGNQEFMSGVPATPEPSSMALGASGALLALYFLRRRKRSVPNGTLTNSGILADRSI
jgi:hypothetical protein